MKAPNIPRRSEVWPLLLFRENMMKVGAGLLISVADISPCISASEANKLLKNMNIFECKPAPIPSNQ